MFYTVHESLSLEAELVQGGGVAVGETLNAGHFGVIARQVKEELTHRVGDVVLALVGDGSAQDGCRGRGALHFAALVVKVPDAEVLVHGGGADEDGFVPVSIHDEFLNHDKPPRWLPLYYDLVRLIETRELPVEVVEVVYEAERVSAAASRAVYAQFLDVHEGDAAYLVELVVGVHLRVHHPQVEDTYVYADDAHCEVVCVVRAGSLTRFTISGWKVSI